MALERGDCSPARATCRLAARAGRWPRATSAWSAVGCWVDQPAPAERDHPDPDGRRLPLHEGPGRRLRRRRAGSARRRWRPCCWRRRRRGSRCPPAGGRRPSPRAGPADQQQGEGGEEERERQCRRRAARRPADRRDEPLRGQLPPAGAPGPARAAVRRTTSGRESEEAERASRASEGHQCRGAACAARDADEGAHEVLVGGDDVQLDPAGRTVSRRAACRASARGPRSRCGSPGRRCRRRSARRSRRPRRRSSRRRELELAPVHQLDGDDLVASGEAATAAAPSRLADEVGDDHDERRGGG